MVEAIKFNQNKTTTADWRLTPGYLHEGRSDFESAHILLGRFLADRTSEDPLLEKELLSAYLSDCCMRECKSNAISLRHLLRGAITTLRGEDDN